MVFSLFGDIRLIPSCFRLVWLYFGRFSFFLAAATCFPPVHTYFRLVQSVSSPILHHLWVIHPYFSAFHALLHGIWGNFLALSLCFVFVDTMSTCGIHKTEMISIPKHEYAQFLAHYKRTTCSTTTVAHSSIASHCLLSSTSNPWVIDYGATEHMTDASTHSLIIILLRHLKVSL